MQKIKQEDKKEIVRVVLETMGVSPHKLGYIYLTAFLSRAWEKQNITSESLNDISNEIALEGQMFAGHMYSAMEYAIEEAWFLGNYRVLEYVFGYSLDTIIIPPPSVKKFIMRTISVLETLESNNSDIYLFFKFLANGGITISRDYKLNYATRY